jgi:hypothetical protein
VTLGNGGKRIAVKNETQSSGHATEHIMPQSQNNMAMLGFTDDQIVIKGHFLGLSALGNWGEHPMVDARHSGYFCCHERF